MSQPAEPRVALTKTLSDGRTAVVTITLGPLTTAPTATPEVTINGVKTGRQSVSIYDAPPEVRAQHPELVAGVGPLLLTATEADQVRAAMQEVRAALPRDLDAERERLVSDLDEAEREPGFRAAELMEAGDPAPFRDQASLEQDIDTARQALAEFDAAHPEVAARAAERLTARVQHIIDGGL